MRIDFSRSVHEVRSTAPFPLSVLGVRSRWMARERAPTAGSGNETTNDGRGRPSLQGVRSSSQLFLTYSKNITFSRNNLLPQRGDPCAVIRSRIWQPKRNVRLRPQPQHTRTVTGGRTN